MTNPLVLSAVISDQTVDVTVPAPVVDVTVAPGTPLAVVTVAGPPGPPGPPGTGTFITGETPGGVQNGSNLVFTTAQAYVTNSTLVYRNGLREHLGAGYTETNSTTITFTTAPLVSDVILIDYTV